MSAGISSGGTAPFLATAGSTVDGGRCEGPKSSVAALAAMSSTGVPSVCLLVSPGAKVSGVDNLLL